ncbi:MAG TPA: hypothetical protein VGL42_00640 [Opitutaceae bacterium]|jgi:hypothetical protein
MFIGHPDAAWKSAVVHSVVGTCKRLGLKPEGYLNGVLPQLAARIRPHAFLAVVKEPAKSPTPVS